MPIQGIATGRAAFTQVGFDQLKEELKANGANAIRLAPAQFESDYQGGLLDGSWHLLSDRFRFESNIDFHV